MATAKIKDINSLFPNVYRVILENDMILDIFEYVKPVIGDSVKYLLSKNTNNEKYDTELNGTVYDDDGTKWLYISFGGLLCTPLRDDVPDLKIFDNVFLKYSILRNQI